MNSRIDIQSLNYRATNTCHELIQLSEENYYAQLSDVVAMLTAAPKRPHLLMLAGPSASSKTTTAHKLADTLHKAGIHSGVISLDDFYINRDDLPTLPNGKVDYETINTLDLACLDQCLGQLIKTHQSDFPIFEFSTGERCNRTRSVHINENTVLIIEGLHAINPIITNGFADSEFLKLYISPNSDYYLDEEVLLCAREVRLIRRIIRDHFYRASSITRTLEMWENVVIAEVDAILPFKKDADYIIDSTIIYEPCVYANELLEIINASTNTSGSFECEIARLKRVAEVFAPIAKSVIPANTVLREFLK